MNGIRSNSRMQTGYLMIALICFAPALVLPFTAVSTMISVVLMICMTAVLLIGFFTVAGITGFDLFAPIYITGFSMWLAYVVNGFFIIFFPDQVITLWGVDVIDRDLTPFLSIILVGLVFYVIGYRLSAGTQSLSWFERLQFFTSLKHWPVKILVIYSIGWIVRIFYVSQGRYTSFYTSSKATAMDPLLYKFWFFCFFAYILAWIYWARLDSKRSTANVLLIFICSLEIGYFLFQGSKTYFTLLLLLPLIILHYHGRRIQVAKLLVIAAVIIVFVFPYVATYRDKTTRSYDTGDISMQILRENVKYSMGDMRSLSVASERPIWSDFISRWGGVAPTVAAIERVPIFADYHYGKDLILLLFALIPRPIMPWKPAAELPTIFAERICGIYGTGISPFPIAECYLNFGIIGVAFGMMALGLLQKKWHRALTIEKDSLKIFIYSATFYDVTNVNSWIITGWIGIVQWIAILIPIVYFMGGRPRH